MKLATGALSAGTSEVSADNFLKFMSRPGACATPSSWNVMVTGSGCRLQVMITPVFNPDGHGTLYGTGHSEPYEHDKGVRGQESECTGHDQVVSDRSDCADCVNEGR